MRLLLSRYCVYTPKRAILGPSLLVPEALAPKAELLKVREYFEEDWKRLVARPS